MEISVDQKEVVTVVNARVAVIVTVEGTFGYTITLETVLVDVLVKVLVLGLQVVWQQLAGQSLHLVLSDSIRRLCEPQQLAEHQLQPV